MIYRSAGRAYAAHADGACSCPRGRPRGAARLLALAAVVLPLVGPDYLFEAILLPFLALSLAAVGLNILTGYAGQLSLGTAAFMAVGAFAAYNFEPAPAGAAAARHASPWPASWPRRSGWSSACRACGCRGFYLAVSTLAAQFFVQWALTKFSWFSNDNASGVITAPHARGGRLRPRPAGRPLPAAPRRSSRC